MDALDHLRTQVPPWEGLTEDGRFGRRRARIFLAELVATDPELREFVTERIASRIGSETGNALMDLGLAGSLLLEAARHEGWV